MTEEISSGFELWQRPTGGTAITTGVVLIMVGVIAGLIWFFTSPMDYLGEIDSELLQRKFWAGVAAGTLMPAGGLTLATGYIVRALYFLDGSEKKPAR